MPDSIEADRRVRWTQIFDVLSFLVVLAVAVDLVYVHRQLNRLEILASGGEGAVRGTKFLPMYVTGESGERIRVPADRQRLIFYISRNCGACARSMPQWSETARVLGRDNVLFLVADADAKVLREMPAYLASYRLQGFVSARIDADVMTRLNMFSVPRVLLVASDGRIREVWQGAVDQKALLQSWNSH